MWGFAQIASAWGAGRHSLSTAALVTIGFALLARLVRGVSVSGALAGALVCFLLYLGTGPGGFIALVAVFAVTWAATKLGYRRKQTLGTAEPREGRRASQVLANLSVAAVCAVLYAFSGSGSKIYWLLAMAAALCEAAADTVSSELGQALSPKARLITTWQEVPAGTDGGISLAGSLAGAAAAVIISAVCVLVGLLPLKQMAIPAAAAMIGVAADSLLGAWLERRGLLNNDAVNLLGTLIAAGAAVSIVGL